MVAVADEYSGNVPHTPVAQTHTSCNAQKQRRRIYLSALFLIDSHTLLVCDELPVDRIKLSDFFLIKMFYYWVPSCVLLGVILGVCNAGHVGKATLPRISEVNSIPTSLTRDSDGHDSVRRKFEQVVRNTQVCTARVHSVDCCDWF